MTIIGLTGGIGSGKSIVAEIFKKLNIFVFDSDSEAKIIMNSDKFIISSIKKEFGEDLYENGILNRIKLSEIIFYNKDAVNFINSLVHPAVIVAFENRVNQYKSPYYLLESAILFESGANKQTNKIISVSAPEDIRIKRVMKRDNISFEHVKARIENQMNEKERITKSDYIINNYNEALIPQVININNIILSQLI